MRRCLLVVNPVAGGGRALKAEPHVRRILEGAGWEVTLQHTRSAEHATEITRACAPGDLVAVLAGDGVLARALQGAYESGAWVAPLSGGRGNDLVRSLGVPVDSMAAARRLVTTARERRIDVGRCNGRFFMGVAAIGIAAVANQIANENTVLKGTAVYVWSVLRALMVFRPARISATLDGVEGTAKAWNIAVANSRSIGGGMRICPYALLDDGALDFNFIRECPIPMVLPALVRIFNGSHLKMREVVEKRAREIRVESDTELAVYADGEFLDVLPAVFTVEPQAVTVVV